MSYWRLIQQANTLICSMFFDLNTTASYGLTVQLFGILSNFAGIMYRSFLPAMNESRLKNDARRLINILAFCICVGWITFIAGSVFLIFYGNEILLLFSSKTLLLEQVMLIFMSIYLLLEFNHGYFSAFITTNNEVPFVGAALISGGMIVAFSAIFCIYTEFGIWGLLISQAVVQALYNNWKWPSRVMRDLDVNMFGFAKIGLQQIVLMYIKNRKMVHNGTAGNNSHSDI